MAAITIKEWLGANKRTHVLPTDKWYLDFAIKLLPFCQKSSLFKNENYRTQTEAAISISQYFQDTISQSGGWKVFSDLFVKRYGTYLPFYIPVDEYIPDEINKEDISFILWTLKSHAPLWEEAEYTFFNPYDEALLALSQTAYDMMDKYFEEAPISDEPSSDFWVMGVDLLEMPATPLPEISTETKLTQDVKHCLEYSKGKPLLYFADYRELRTFFIEALKWENHPSSLLPDLEHKKEFVIYANAKGMLIAQDVAAYFCERHNPVYDARRAATEGYEMFCRPGKCPFDLLKYGMTKEILPDMQLPFSKGKELLHKYWDFIARYYLCEYYEGK